MFSAKPITDSSEYVPDCTASGRHRAGITPHDVLALDRMADRINHEPRHARKIIGRPR